MMISIDWTSELGRIENILTILPSHFDGILGEIRFILAGEMLHEIILSLLGFTGNIIVRNRDDSSFEEGRQDSYGDVFDLLTEAEQEQVNRIVHLGWLYDALRNYIQVHQPNFGTGVAVALYTDGSDSASSGVGVRQFEVYKAAMSLGLSDLLEEYVADVADIEGKIVLEGALPLSYLLQHMQAYLLAMPVLHAILTELENRNCRGAQLLDYLATYQSGVTLVNSIVQRMLLRVRVVFLKQTLGWMLHGVLSDPACEYFIIDKQQQRAGNASPTPPSSGFDWTGAFGLRLECVPESHVSPRAAAKILFAGKAVRLLHVAVNDHKTSGTNTDTDIPDSSFSEASGHDFLNYFGGRGVSKKGTDIGKDSPKASHDNVPLLSMLQKHTSKPTSSNSSSDIFDSDGFLKETLQAHCASNGFSSLEEFYGFASQFQEIILKPDLAVELLERLVDDVHDLVSMRLWTVIRDKYQCFRYLHVLRNTFLLGKGEFFQSLLDEVLLLVQSSVPPDTQHANKLLQHTIMRRVGRRLNLDLDPTEDATLGFQLQVISENMVVGSNDFGPLQNSGEISYCGSAVVMPFKVPDSNGNGIDLAGNRPSRRQFLRVGASKPVVPAVVRAAQWAQRVGTPNASSLSETVSNSFSPFRCDYNFGSANLAEERYVTKGFNLSTTFTCAWNSVSSVGPSHSLFQSAETGTVSKGDILLGAVSNLLHSGSARKGMDWDGSASIRFVRDNSKKPPSSRTFLVQENLSCMGLMVPNSLSVGVSFHARVVGETNERRVEYFARVFVCGDNHEQSSTGTGGRLFGAGGLGTKRGETEVLAVSQDDIQLFLCTPQEWRASSVRDVTRRALCAASSLVLEVEYSREVVPVTSNAVTTTAAAATKGVVYKLKARLREMGSRSSSSNMWDINLPLSLESKVRLRAGKCAVGVVGSGVTVGSADTSGTDGGNSASSKEGGSSFHMDVTALEFRSKGSGGAQAPAASPQLSAREPLVYARLEEILSRYKYWTNLKLSFTDTIPSVFCAMFDAESLKSYASMFTFLIKVRTVMYSLERLYLQRRQVIQTGFRPARSARRKQGSRGGGGGVSRAAETDDQRRDRVLGHLRHCMLFFLGNLFFYLQVDVIDAEYENLCGEIKSNHHSDADATDDNDESEDGKSSQNFKSVLQAHKNYLATVIRLSMVDNVIVQDAIERVLHGCMRVIAVYHFLLEEDRDRLSVLQHQFSSGEDDEPRTKQPSSSSSIPLQEVEALKKDFFSQMSYLLQIMRKVENRGFIFRIDFNGFMSEMASDIGRSGASVGAVGAGSSSVVSTASSGYNRGGIAGKS